MLIHGELIQPGHKQIGLARLVIVQGKWAAARQQIDDVEVVDVAYEGRNRSRGGHEDHIGQRDAGEAAEGSSAVQLRALVEVGGNVHQHAAEGQHCVGNADPHIDDHHADPRQGLVRQKRERGGDEPQLHQRNVDRAHRFQRAGDQQQTYKLRDSDGDDEECPPHLFHPYQLMIDEDRQQHSEDIVGKGRQDRPDDRPAKDAEESVGLRLVTKENVCHVGKPSPSEELAGRLMG